MINNNKTDKHMQHNTPDLKIVDTKESMDSGGGNTQRQQNRRKRYGENNKIQNL